MDNLVKRPESKATYDNYIGRKFVAPNGGQNFDLVFPTYGKVWTALPIPSGLILIMLLTKQEKLCKPGGKRRLGSEVQF